MVVETLFERIQAHLASDGKPVVIIATCTRATEYQAKHAAYFVAPRDPADRGVYVRQGKRLVYCLPDVVRFGRYVTK